MTRIKEFQLSQLSKRETLEEQVNMWLKTNNTIKIISFQVVEHKGSLMLYLLYDMEEE